MTSGALPIDARRSARNVRERRLGLQCAASLATRIAISTLPAEDASSAMARSSSPRSGDAALSEETLIWSIYNGIKVLGKHGILLPTSKLQRGNITSVG